jgi:hypothetical protein
MKISKKKLVIIGLILVLVGLSQLRLYYKKHPEYTYYKRKSEVEDAVKTILETGEEDGIQIPGVFKIKYRHKQNHPVIFFLTSGFGLAPSSTQYGFYYSVDSIPVEYGGLDHTLKEEGDHWRWSGEGDNHGSTKHIEGKWYTFKYSN